MTNTSTAPSYGATRNPRSLLQRISHDRRLESVSAEAIITLLTIVAEEIDYRADRRIDIDSIETAEWLFEQADKLKLASQAKR
jgi:hypothetical protein